MKHSKTLCFVLGIILCCVLQTGCQPKPVSVPPQTSNEELAEIRGTFLDGTTFNPKEYAGKVVILDFWATWCPPCRREIAQTLIPMYEQYHAMGLEIVGVSCDQDGQTVQAYTQQNGITWKQMLEENAQFSDGTMLSERYGVRYIPFPVLIGRDGQIVSMNLRGSNLKTAVEQELSK